MKNTLLLYILFVAVGACAQQQQTIKLTQLETAKVVESSRAGQIGLTNTEGKQRYAQYVEIDLTPIAFVPTSTGNLSNYSEFVTDPAGDKWYIDWQGRGYKFPGGGGVDKNGYYGGNGGNGGDATVPSATKSTLTNQLTWEIPTSLPGGTVPLRVDVADGSDFADWMSMRSGPDSLLFRISDDNIVIEASAFTDLQLKAGGTVRLNGDSIHVQNVADAYAQERTFVMRSHNGFLTKKEGISWSDLNQAVKDSIDAAGGSPVNIYNSDGTIPADIQRIVSMDPNAVLSIKYADGSTGFEQYSGVNSSALNSYMSMYSYDALNHYILDANGLDVLYNSNTSTNGFYLHDEQFTSNFHFTHDRSDQYVENATTGQYSRLELDNLDTGGGTALLSTNRATGGGYQLGFSPVYGGVGKLTVQLDGVYPAAGEVLVGDGFQGMEFGPQKDGIYGGSGNIPTSSVAKIASGGNFGIAYFNNNLGLNIDESNNGIQLASEDNFTSVHAFDGEAQIVSGDGGTDECKGVFTPDSVLLRAAGVGGDSKFSMTKDYCRSTKPVLIDYAQTAPATNELITEGYLAANAINFAPVQDVQGSGNVSVATFPGGIYIASLTGTIPIVRGGTGLNALGTSLQQLRVNAGATALEYFTPSAGSGTVTSVNMTVPGELAVSGVPITTSGTAAVSWNTQTTNKVFAAPNGSTGVPTFRALAAEDLPAPAVITPSQITADQDDYSPTGWAASDVVRISGDNGIRAITSFAAVTSHLSKTLINVGSYPIYMPSEHPDGTAANRISLPADYILYPYSSIDVFYDATSSRWRIKGAQVSPFDYRSMYYNWSSCSTSTGDNSAASITAMSSGSISSTAQASGTTPAGAVISSLTTTNGGGRIAFAKDATQYVTTGQAHTYFSSLITLPVLSDATDTYVFYSQISNTASSIVSANPNATIGIRYSHNVNSGKWEGYSKSSGGTETTVDLGVTVTAGQTYLLRTELDKANTEIRFYIDETFVGRLASSISSGAYGSRVCFIKTAGSTARTALIHTISAAAIYP